MSLIEGFSLRMFCGSNIIKLHFSGLGANTCTVHYNIQNSYSGIIYSHTLRYSEHYTAFTDHNLEINLLDFVNLHYSTDIKCN
jgi:hypothetical protein